MGQLTMKIKALCHTCAKQHLIDFDPAQGPGAAFGDWLNKHPLGHETDFVWPERSWKIIEPEEGWLHYVHNADVKTAYGTSTAFTITLASLASSSTLLTGRQGTAISNSTNLYLDYFISALITTGTTPTASKQINLWMIAAQNDTPAWPDAFGGTDAGVTAGSSDILGLCGALHSTVTTSSSSNIGYPFKMTSLASMFGGICPRNFIPFVTHSTAVNLNSTAGNQYVTSLGVYATVA